MAMVAEMTVSGSSFFYSAVAEMDLDSVATTVVVAADATTDAASYLQRVRFLRTLLHILIFQIIYIDNVGFRRHLWKTGR